MSDSLMTIIGIFIAIIIMFIYPLMSSASKNDEIAQTVVQTVLSDFVNEVISRGQITEFEYNELMQKLGATGNTYDVQIEVQVLDDNSKRATSTSVSSLTESERYYSVYTNTVLDEVRNNGKFILKKNDVIIVTAKNTNITIGTQLKNIIYKLIGKDTYTIGATCAGIVINGGV